MKNMVDRYIYDVIRRLPEGERNDVERELRANIRDMLSDNPDEKEIVSVLESLGEPSKLAEQYRAHPRYLISPAMFEQYMAAIRIIVPMAAVVMGLLGLLLDLAKSSVLSVGFAAASLITHALSAGMTALFVTTMGFAVADHCQFSIPGKKWSPNDIPDLPSKTAVRIPRGESFVGMVFSVILIAFIFAAMRNPGLIGWYEPAKAAVSLFNATVFTRFAPWFILVSFTSLAVSFIKLILGRWTQTLAAVNTAHSLLSAAVFILFLTGTNTFNPAIAVKIGEVLSRQPEQIAHALSSGLKIWVWLTALFTAIDVGTGWYKALKGRQQQNLDKKMA